MYISVKKIFQEIKDVLPISIIYCLNKVDNKLDHCFCNNLFWWVETETCKPQNKYALSFICGM